MDVTEEGTLHIVPICFASRHNLNPTSYLVLFWKGYLFQIKNAKLPQDMPLN